MELILASQSPRRKELLGILNIPFRILVANIDESLDETLTPAENVARLSRRKAEAIPCQAEDIVIAADTVVVCNGQILGKPKDEADAFRMLSMLSGKSHQVMTGLTVLRGETCVSTTEITDVFFRELEPKEIRDYIATGHPMDKAGSYGIQGGAALFVEKLVGDYFNVVGLPLCKLGMILKEFL